MKCVKDTKYKIVYCVDVIACKIKHLFETSVFHKNVELEQKKRHDEYYEYCKKYLEELQKIKQK